ncbi:MAG: response regulator [Candidatus Paceibacterota bacterium]|jgi:CheY-like chemotaxis protein
MKDTRVLIVDEGGIRVVLNALLSREGYKVQMAADGEEAINVLQQETFDLIILEAFLPKVDGFEVLEFIQNNKTEFQNSKIKAIILSSYYCLNQKDVTTLKNLGVAEILYKPYDSLDLLVTIERVLSEKEKVPAV